MVSDDQICVAWDCDIGTPINPVELEDFVTQNMGRRKDVCSLLSADGPFGEDYNELIVRGCPGIIQGIVHYPGKKRAVKRLEKLIRKSGLDNIPVIKLPKKTYEFTRNGYNKKKSVRVRSFREFYNADI